MAWVKLEDTFAEHPKVQKAGDEAAWLYVSGLLYCSRALTDGFIPTAKVPQLTSLKSPRKLADKLVVVGLWESAEDGYKIHDFHDYQQSASTRRHKQTQDAERQRKRRATVTDTSQRDTRVTNNGVTPMSRMAEVEVEVEVEEEGTTTTSPTDSGGGTTPGPAAGLFREVVADLERRAH